MMVLINTFATIFLLVAVTHAYVAVTNQDVFIQFYILPGLLIRYTAEKKNGAIVHHITYQNT